MMLRCVFSLLFLSSRLLFGFSVSMEEAEKLGDKIWRNECGGTTLGLTCWNERENFASMGIGHFIWYPKGHKEPFEETFPSFLSFLQKEKVTLPPWLEKNKACPWSSRVEFYEAIEAKSMKELRAFLKETKSMQALFMAKRLENTFLEIKKTLPEKKREEIEEVFYLLAKDAKGLYALIDYLNFKGSGLSSFESYAGNRWGLLQVLERISLTSKTPLLDFVKAAKFLLSQRVEHAPKGRGEEKYLKGWFNRLDTYLSN